MSNESQDLKIHIISDADVKGFTQTSQATKGLKVDTSDLSDETKRSLGIFPQLESATKKSGEAAAESGLSHRELRKVLMDIGNVAAPGAGRSLAELGMGPVGIALALVGAYEALRGSLEADSEAADKLGEELAKPDTAGIKGVQDAWDAAAKSYGEYLAKLATAGKDNDPIKTEIERAKQIVVAQLEARKKAQESMGDKAGAEYTQQSIDRTKGASSLIAEQDAREKAQRKLEEDAAAASLAQQQANQKYQDDQAKLTKSRETATPGTEANKALRKKIDDANAAVEDAQNIPDVRVDPLSNTVTDNHAVKAKAIADAQSAAKMAQDELDRAKREADQLSGNQIQRDQAKAAADQAATEAKAAAEKNKGRLNELPGEISQEDKLAGIREHSQKVQDILETHGAQTGETFGKLAAATGKSQEATMRFAEAIIAGHDNLATRLTIMEQQLAAQRQQTTAMPSQQY